MKNDATANLEMLPARMFVHRFQRLLRQTYLAILNKLFFSTCLVMIVVYFGFAHKYSIQVIKVNYTLLWRFFDTFTTYYIFTRCWSASSGFPGFTRAKSPHAWQHSGSIAWAFRWAHCEASLFSSSSTSRVTR